MKLASGLFLAVLLMQCECAAWSQETQSPQKCIVVGPHTKADVQSVEEWCRGYTAAVEAGNLRTYRTFWSEDVIWLPPGEPIIKGIDACMDHHRSAFEGLKQTETFWLREIRFGSDFTALRVDYVYQGVPKPNSDATPVDEVGKGIFLLRRQPNGSWIATHCVWNLDSPRD